MLHTETSLPDSFPDQIKKFRPSSHHWCMRTEGKNSFFKRKKLKNAKNVPFTLAFDHQVCLCFQQNSSLGNQSITFLRVKLTTTPKRGQEVDVDNYIYCAELLAELNKAVNKICVVTQVNKKGIVYRIGDFLINRFDEQREFMRIHNIVVLDKNTYFVVLNCVTDKFNCHQNYYEAVITNDEAVFSQSDLLYLWPLLFISKSHDKFSIVPLSLPKGDEII